MALTKNIEEIISEGEGYLVEFKESAKHLDKEICAFANASGGTIYVGLTDSGKVKKTKLTNALKSEIQNIASSLEPTPKIKIESFENIVRITVLESDQKPVRASQGFYLRVGANSQKLNREAILKFAVSQYQIYFDTQLYIEEEATSLLSNRLVEKFREKAKLPDDIENLDLLKNLGCLQWQQKTPYLTYAGILLFTDQPQAIFPTSTLTFLVMQDESTILKQEIIRGNLLNQVEQALILLKQNLVSQIKIESLKREEKFEFPEYVLRELLVNTVVHRDYFEGSADIVIKIFPRFIEFSNPSSLPKNLKPSELFGKSFRKNPLLADLFFRCGYIERAGTGLLRIQKALEKMELPPLKLKQEGPFFIAELKRNVPGAVDENDLNERQTQILNFKTDFFPFSTRDYAKKFDISLRMARRDIKTLLKLKLLRKIKEGQRIFYTN